MKQINDVLMMTEEEFNNRIENAKVEGGLDERVRCHKNFSKLLNRLKNEKI